jgi:hypothetical protein
VVPATGARPLDRREPQTPVTQAGAFADRQTEGDARQRLAGPAAHLHALVVLAGLTTKGDELTYVEPGGTLVSGDAVQNKVVPNIFGDGGTPSSWIAVLDKISALHVQHVLPDHSAPGDGSLVLKERAFIDDLRTRALALKQQGVSADDAGKQLAARPRGGARLIRFSKGQSVSMYGPRAALEFRPGDQR